MMKIDKQAVVKVVVLALGKALLEGLNEAKEQRDTERKSSPVYKTQSRKRQAQSAHANFWKQEGEQTMNHETQHPGKFGAGMLLGSLFGAAVGAGLALWYAPQSGRKTQQILQRKANQLHKNVNKKANALYDEVEDIAENARERARERVGEWHEQGRQFVDEKVSQVNEAAQSIRERVSR